MKNEQEIETMRGKRKTCKSKIRLKDGMKDWGGMKRKKISRLENESE